MNHKEKSNYDRRHMIKMILACIIPLVIIVILFFFGISNKWTTIGAIGLMVLLHVLMMKDHFKGGGK